MLLPIASFNRRQIFEGSTQFVLRSLIVASNLLPTLNFPNPPNLFATVRLCKYHRAQCPALHSTAQQIKRRLLLLASLVKNFYMNSVLIEYRRMIKWENIFCRQDVKTWHKQKLSVASSSFIGAVQCDSWRKKLGFSINWIKKSEISQRLCSGVLRGAGVSGGGLGVFAADHPKTGHRVTTL